GLLSRIVDANRSWFISLRPNLLTITLPRILPGGFIATSPAAAGLTSRMQATLGLSAAAAAAAGRPEQPQTRAKHADRAQSTERGDKPQTVPPSDDQHEDAQAAARRRPDEGQPTAPQAATTSAHTEHEAMAG